MTPGADRPLRMLLLARRELADPMSGGSEVLVDRLARGLVERGHEVTLVCGGPVGARPYPVRCGGGRLGQFPRAPLTYLLHHRHADLVVDVANGLSFLVPMWRRKPSLCLVNHLHTDQWDQWFPAPVAAMGRTFERHVMPWTYRHRRFVAVSESTASGLEAIGVPRDNIRIVPNGVDLPGEIGAESHEPLFLYLGRLVPHKRVELALEAWERVRPVVGGRLVIAGDGPERGRLEALAGEGVVFSGQVSEGEKGRLLDRAWLLVQPALIEGWGLVVMEAAARRTPTLAFDVPGLRDSILDGRTGWLLPPDRPLADGLDHALRTLADDVVAEQYAVRCRAWADRFSWDSTAERVAAVVMGEVERVHQLLRSRRVSSDLAVRVEARLEADGPASRRLTGGLRRSDQLRQEGDRLRVLLHGCDETGAGTALRRLGIEDVQRMSLASPGDLLLGAAA